MNIDTARLHDSFVELLQAFPTYCLLPAVTVVLIGVLCHRFIGRRHPSFYGEDGLRLREVGGCSLATGLMIGSVRLIPLPFETVIVIGTVLFALGTAFITWSSRESVSAVFIALGGMMLGVGTFEGGIALADAAFDSDLTIGSLSGTYLAMWALYGSPGTVCAGIAASLSLFSMANAETGHAPAAAHVPQARVSDHASKSERETFSRAA